MKKTVMFFSALAFVFNACSNKSVSKNEAIEEKLIMENIDKLYDIWGLKKMNEKEVPASKGMKLEINTKEMKFSGFTSCNNMFGTLSSTDKNKIMFKNIGSTRKLCPDDMQTETSYLNNLRKVESFQLKGLKLLLLDEQNKVLLEYIKLD